jgi:signal transduction histidine kinase
MDTVLAASEIQQTQRECLTLLRRDRDAILLAWQKQVEAAAILPFYDAALQTWLSRYLDAFIQETDEDQVRASDEVFCQFAGAVTSAGAPVAAATETMLWLSHAVETLRSAGHRGDVRQDCLSGLIMRRMAHNLTSFVENLAKESDRRQARTDTLLRVAKAASSSLDLDKVLHIIADEITQALDTASCNSFLFRESPRSGHYILLDSDPESDYHVPDPPELFGMDALTKGEPVICYDAALDPRTDKETVRYFGLTSLMAFPLISNGKTIASGLVVMKDYHHFTQDEIDLVMGIASSTAVAMENARLFEATKQLAIMEERNRLSLEMHDNLAQSLAVIKLDINALLAASDAGLAQRTLQEMKALVDETYTELRDSIFGLRAINESDTSFLDNFKNYLETFGIHSNLSIECSLNEREINLLSKEAVLQVGRILEEALSNVRKHAQAERVWIKSGQAGEQVWITVEDDGIGLEASQHNQNRTGHFGLKVMAERAAGVGGCCSVSPRQPAGTCVKLIIPCA